MFKKCKVKPEAEQAPPKSTEIWTYSQYSNSGPFLNDSVRNALKIIQTVEHFEKVVSESPSYQAMKRNKLQGELDAKLAETSALSKQIMGLQS